MVMPSQPSPPAPSNAPSPGLNALNQQRSPRPTSERSEKMLIQHQAQSRALPVFPQLPSNPPLNATLATPNNQAPLHAERVKQVNKGSS
jgi:hypothetical protein